MSATTTRSCEGCGVTSDTLNEHAYCLNCEHLHIEADRYAAQVTLDLIESTVRQALELSYVHPDDVLVRVGQVLRETTTRAATDQDLRRANRRNMAARASLASAA
jgi:hypothetical protein